MKRIKVDVPNNLNIEVLDEDLKASFAQIDGVQFNPQTQELLVVSFDDNVDENAVKALVTRHDPTKKTKREQRREQRKQRANDAKTLDIKGNNPNVKDIAKYVLALEARIEELEERLGVQ